ncbi:polyketide synthase [Cordyceps javanica]|uniref:Polyketide synthase n=1 Tax=Cordyceps javanica TaxID=43265 RepID=A0A545UX06_9HYPO|nr:polyketide synthase [Cordyceps javanica]TQW01698.1 polyketide synthase [Cordyceps javanica]
MADDSVAIIGLSCRFSGDATSPDKLWSLLENGQSAWSEIPQSRFNPVGAYHPAREKLSTSHIRGGHFLKEDPGLFDATFFNFTAETATTLDPQFRLQLESVYEALENAGLALSDIAGSNTSVFAGTFFHDYRDSLVRDEDNLPRSFITGIGSAMASNRISHFFDLRGASMTIDTGCSTTLVALHQAVENLRSRGSDMSIVGGANILLNPDNFKALGSFGFLSPDGKCFSFDERANGYGRGEGVATVVLKRLTDAIAAGDPIRAIIRESVLNQDGKTESLTSPSPAAQESLMRDCYAKAGLNPGDTQYFEAHGTGTPTGDPIEIGAISTVFKTEERREPLRIGSIKTNIGHTEATSGLASVIKVVLAMERGLLPPSINFEQPNKSLKLDERRFKVVTELERWPVAPGQTMRASVNNFGYGGANAHVILEDAVYVSDRRAKKMPCRRHTGNLTSGQFVNEHKIVVVSAKDERAHEAMISQLAAFLRQKESEQTTDPEKLLDNLIFTLGQRRTLFSHVSAYPVPVLQGLEAVAEALETPKFKPRRRSPHSPRLGMIFTGQGAQWYAMGRELMTTYPVYRQTIEEADACLQELGANWSLLQELGRDRDTSRVNQTAFSIPICAAVQIALVRLLETWGVKPSAVTSHSSGEIAAAYAVGAISLRLGMGIAYYRSSLSAEMTSQMPGRGGMLAVGVGHIDVAKYFERLTDSGRVVVACVNSPSSTTVAGDATALDELDAILKAENVFSRRLRVDIAYHSHHMEPIAKDYRRALKAMPTEEPKAKTVGPVAFSSPVTGYRMTNTREIARPDHWVSSLLQPVQFVDAFIEMVHGDITDDADSQSVDVLVEIGPHTALGGPIKEIMALEEFENIQLPYYGSLVRNSHAVESLQALASNLLKEGYPLNMEAVNFPAGTQGLHVMTDLPSYPWNHQTRYWSEPRFNLSLRQRAFPPHELLGSLVTGANPEKPVWRHTLRTTESPWLRDHAVQSIILYPGCGFVCLAIEAATQKLALTRGAQDKTISGYDIRNMSVEQALVVPDSSDGIEIQTTLYPAHDQKSADGQVWHEFEVYSISSDNRWMRHASGQILVELEELRTPLSSDFKLGSSRQIDPDDMWKTLELMGIKYGPTFRNISDIHQSKKELRSTSTITVPDTAMEFELPRDYIIHPATLDAVAQSAFTALPGAAFCQASPRVFQSIERIWISSKISNKTGHNLQCQTSLDYADPHGIKADVSVLDRGAPAIEVQGLQLRSLGAGVTQSLHPILCSKIVWDCDIDLNVPGKLILRTEEDMKLEQLSLYFIEQTLASKSTPEANHLAQHHGDYLAALKDIFQLRSPMHDLSGCKLSAEQLSSVSERAALLCSVGSRLPDILRGELTVGNAFGKDILSSSLKHETDYSVIISLLRKALHKRPRSRVLEIGATHSGIASRMAKVFGTTGAFYHLTSESVEVLEDSKQILEKCSDSMAFDTLDITEQPDADTFNVSSYDVIIAPAEKLSIRALENIESLLVPGGKLLVACAQKCELDSLMVLGLVPSWWEANSSEASPRLNMAEWDLRLKNAGFSGIDFMQLDPGSSSLQQTYTLLTTLPKSDKPAPPAAIDITILTVKSSNVPPTSWIELLLAKITKMLPFAVLDKSHVLDIESVSEEAIQGKVCVFLGELYQPVLRDAGTQTFEAIKTLVTKCNSLLWVTRGGFVDCEKPDLGLAAGFLRAARSEYLGRQYVVLDLDPCTPDWTDMDIDGISGVLNAISRGSLAGEYEYAVRDGLLEIPRIVNDLGRNHLVSPLDETDVENSSLVSLHKLGPTHSLSVCTPGKLDTLSFVETEPRLDPAELAAAMVYVETHAYGLNTRDLNIVSGRLHHENIGVEFSGIITSLGEEASAKGFAVGDRVMGLVPEGNISGAICTPWDRITRIPSNVNFEEAAAVLASFCIAHMSLIDIARMRTDQTVLIHDAAASVGQAAIVVAYATTSEVFVTTESEGDREFISKRYGIPKDHILSRQDPSFTAQVLDATNGLGIDIVLGSQTRHLSEENAKILAPFGHLIDIVENDPEDYSNSIMRLLEASTSFSTFSLSSLLSLAQRNSNKVYHTMSRIAELIENSTIRPAPLFASYPITNAVQAFRHLQTADRIKTVLSVDADATVLTRQLSSKPIISPTATYLLIGGVGGIGRAIASWLADQGARFIVVLSRSAGKSEQAAKLAEELGQSGCLVKAISCDVSDAQDLARAVHQCNKDNLPPIRGIIQGAMVLKDTLLERMTFEDYRIATKPKVDGTWNLHKEFCLPDSLDFFVILSSAVAVAGNASQANYAAGGSYQDALARWRVSNGLPAVSINLGAVKGTGIAENSGVLGHLQRVGYTPIHEEQVLSVLSSAIDSPYEPQIVVGLDARPGPHWDATGESQLGRDMRFLPLRPPETDAGAASNQPGGANSLANVLAKAKSPEEAAQHISSAIAHKISEIFMIPVDQVEIANAPAQYGVDSLVAIELRNMLVQQTAAEVSIFDIMQSTSIGSLAGVIAAKSPQFKV